MRRRLLLALLLVLMSVGLPARADFHGACLAIATGVARVDLISHVDDGSFTFTGLVNCPGAVVNITSVDFINVTTFSEGDVPFTTSNNCGTSPCLASENVAMAVSPGDVLEVSMKFDASGSAILVGAPTSYTDVPRKGRWIYQADGALVPTCVSGLFSSHVCV